MLNYTITIDDHCRRLESYLQRLLPAAAPAYVRKLVKSGACRVNKADTDSGRLLRVGDLVSLKESSTVSGLLGSRPLPIDLLWQDDRLLVINKPAGLAMHAAAEVDENLADIVSDWLEKKSSHPVRAYPVNRLDRGTSGVVLMATSSTNAGILGRQVKEQGLDKVYLSVVEGHLSGSGTIDQALDGKDSVTRFRCLYSSEFHSFLLVEPVTGRTHQIRRHLSALGHPVVGDRRYEAAPVAGLPGIALHSFRTTLQHPTAEDLMTLYAPLPKAFRETVVQACGLSEAGLVTLIDSLES